MTAGFAFKCFELLGCSTCSCKHLGSIFYMRFSAHSYLFHFSLFISTRVSKFNNEHLRGTKKADRQFTISKKSLNRNCAANQFIYFKSARKKNRDNVPNKNINKRRTKLIFVNNYIGASQRVLGVTEHLEHPENTPMLKL